MIRLNKKIRNGNHIIIPKYLSWQVDQEDLSGEWVIKKTYRNYEIHFMLHRVHPEPFIYNVIYINYQAASYLMGEDVKKIKHKLLDPRYYQPTLEEMDNKRESYITDDEDKYRPFYCGIMRGKDGQWRPVIDVELLKNKWLYK